MFLFVNERCYATQIQSLLNVPLTPIQKALLRLETEGIINSQYEGKTRIYQFNSSYPLRCELEILLKKAYTLLPTQEKKRYCFIHKPRLRFSAEQERDHSRKNELLAFWKKLATIKKLAFSAKSRQDEESLIKIGNADVTIASPISSVLIFQEKGVWFLDQLPGTGFNNSFRWTLDLNSSLITLEHLRYGATHPVFLFHFTPKGKYLLESVDAHLYADDINLGNIIWNQESINFHWRIIGPEKNNQLIYQYT